MCRYLPCLAARAPLSATQVNLFPSKRRFGRSKLQPALSNYRHIRNGKEARGGPKGFIIRLDFARFLQETSLGQRGIPTECFLQETRSARSRSDDSERPDAGLSGLPTVRLAGFERVCAAIEQKRFKPAALSSVCRHIRNAQRHFGNVLSTLRERYHRHTGNRSSTLREHRAPKTPMGISRLGCAADRLNL